MKKNKFFIVLFWLIVFLITVADLIKKDQFFSESENRILKKKPQFTTEEFVKGEYGKKYEEYINDQFIRRDFWVLLKTYMDMGFRKKEINGIYPVSVDTLLEKHNVEKLEEKAGQQIENLKELAKQCDGKYNLSVMLIPTADDIYREKLPKYAPFFNQEEFIKKVEKEVKNIRFIKVREKLEQHKNEYIYYRTDHHWTTLGAYYGYCAWTSHKEAYVGEKVTEDFLGTLHGKLNIPIKPDSIEIFMPKKKQSYEVYYDFSENPADSFYEKKYLSRKDKYSLFFGGNHDFIQIHTKNENKKNILVIKDSYANCFIPFLTEYYENIYVVDFRYFRGDLQDLLQKYKTDDILVLFNVIQFIEEFRF